MPRLSVGKLLVVFLAVSCGIASPAAAELLDPRDYPTSIDQLLPPESDLDLVSFTRPGETITGIATRAGADVRLDFVRPDGTVVQSEDLALKQFSEEPDSFAGINRSAWKCSLAGTQMVFTVRAGSDSEVTKSAASSVVPCDRRWSVQAPEEVYLGKRPEIYVLDKWREKARYQICITSPSRKTVCLDRNTSSSDIESYVSAAPKLTEKGRYEWAANFEAGTYSESGTVSVVKPPPRKPPPKQPTYRPPPPCFSTGIAPRVRILRRFNSSCAEARGVLKDIARGRSIYPWFCRRLGYATGTCTLPAINANDVQVHEFSFKPA